MSRRARGVLVLLLLALRLTYPSGYMPEWGRGGLTLVPCTGLQPAAAPASAPAHHHHETSEDGKREVAPPCPYAVPAAQSALLGDVPHVGPAVPSRPLTPAVLTSQVEPRRSSLRPRSRGPPRQAHTVT